MNPLYGLFSVIVVASFLSGCSNNYSSNKIGISNSQPFIAGKSYYYGIANKLQSQDFDVDMMSGDGVTVYSLDNKEKEETLIDAIPSEEVAINNDDGDYVSSTGVKLTPPEFSNGSIEMDNAVTLYSFEGKAIKPKTPDDNMLPDLVPPSDRAGGKYVSPFNDKALLKEPKNLLTK